jgi:hypothetical protein
MREQVAAVEAAKVIMHRQPAVGGETTVDIAHQAIDPLLVQESDVSKIKRAVNEVATRYPELRKIDNKKVYELQPDVDWNKAKP